MPNLVQAPPRQVCVGCGKKYTEEEFRALPIVKLGKEHSRWPYCIFCGWIKFRAEDSDGEDEE